MVVYFLFSGHFCIPYIPKQFFTCILLNYDQKIQSNQKKQNNKKKIEWTDTEKESQAAAEQTLLRQLYLRSALVGRTDQCGSAGV